MQRIGFGEFSEYLLSAMVFGCLIGVERQWRHSVAGLRTNTLVSVGAAAFALVAQLAPGGDQSFRIVAQIVSGIGFIGGGAILREGFSIKGLNTAATLWCSAAIGSLCGTGHMREAALLSAIILFANLILRPLARKLERPQTLRQDAETHYSFRVICGALEESHVRVALVQAVQSVNLLLKSVHSENVEPAGRVDVRAVLVSPAKHDQLVEQIVNRLSVERSVTSVSWEVMTQLGDAE